MYESITNYKQFKGYILQTNSVATPIYCCLYGNLLQSDIKASLDLCSYKMGRRLC